MEAALHKLISTVEKKNIQDVSTKSIKENIARIEVKGALAKKCLCGLGVNPTKTKLTKHLTEAKKSLYSGLYPQIEECVEIGSPDILAFSPPDFAVSTSLLKFLPFFL